MKESKYEWMFNKLNGYFDMLFDSGFLSDDEEEEMNELNDDINHLIRNQEARIQQLEEEIAAARLKGAEELAAMALDRYGMWVDFQIRKLLADYKNQGTKEAPYEECANCAFDPQHCDGVVGKRFCVEFEEGEGLY